MVEFTIPDHRQEHKIRRFRSAFEDLVPAVVWAYVTTLVESAKGKVDEMEIDHALRHIQDNFSIEHRPQPAMFQDAFLERRAHPAEVKIDPQTDRVYLVGLGLPGREELRIEPRDILDEKGQVVGREPITTTEVMTDAVLVYTEVTWPAYHTASERARNLHDWVRQGLCRYFQIPEHLLTATLLALPGFTDEDLAWIASNAQQHS